MNFITEYYEIEITYKKASRKLKQTSPENKRKHNVIITVFYETQTNK